MGLFAGFSGYLPSGFNSSTNVSSDGAIANQQSVAAQQAAIQNQMQQDQTAYNNSLSPINMITATPQSGMQTFFNTPQYQLLFGNSGTIVDPTANPVQRYQQSPAFQFNVDQTNMQVQRAAAAQGLLNSGNTLQQLHSYDNNLQNQDYNQWQNNMSTAYNNYQNQLFQLAQLGTGATNNISNTTSNLGAQQAQTGVSGLNNIASLYNNTGSSLAGINMQMGSNIAQLQAAQAASGGGLGGIGGLLSQGIGLLGGLF